MADHEITITLTAQTIERDGQIFLRTHFSTDGRNFYEYGPLPTPTAADALFQELCDILQKNATGARERAVNSGNSGNGSHSFPVPFCSHQNMA